MPVAASPQHGASLPDRDRHVRGNIAGIHFDFVIATEVARMIDSWRRSGVHNYLSITNAHSVMVCRRDSEMHWATTHAALTLPDSIGIVLAAMILGYGRCHRTSGPELMLRICDQGREYGLRHFFYGGDAGVPERLAMHLGARFPGLAVAGTYAPPFRRLEPDEDQAVVDRINASRPDVLWVGLGAPKQEKWMASHAGQIQATTMIGVGAAFDFHSGNVKWAPTCDAPAGIGMDPSADPESQARCGAATSTARCSSGWCARKGCGWRSAVVAPCRNAAWSRLPSPGRPIPWTVAADGEVARDLHHRAR